MFLAYVRTTTAEKGESMLYGENPRGVEQSVYVYRARLLRSLRVRKENFTRHSNISMKLLARADISV